MTPKMARIKKIAQETPSIRTFYLDLETDAKPGQFAMAWLPRVDEKPFTLTGTGNETAITVQEKGKFTKKMFELKEGNSIGIRGPFGKGFDFGGAKNACIVAGGCGAAPLLMLAEELKKRDVNLKIVLGARTGNECLFKERLKNTGEIYITTDDGSLGEKGFTTSVLERLLEKEKFDCVFGCGPEPMLVRVFELCEKFGAECQLNLERFMKCATGICGQCAIDEWLVCKDGPVFKSTQIRKMRDFGKFAMLKSAKKVSLQEYAQWRQK
ncbi:MAG: dihydroorotate dehydrogenase electron transfer subunit [Candidatus Diapherotrites archaeon]|nr:dihydroorotate dehydrogenase electron transfer subunit [Candidatus Diapherotrites archaeon]